jgi:hypothetical protein
VLIIAPSPDFRPAPLFAPTRKAAKRFLEFFTAQINNAHTRRAYLNATRRFAGWCASKDLHDLAQVQPFHVAAFVHDQAFCAGSFGKPQTATLPSRYAFSSGSQLPITRSIRCWT